MFLIESCIIIKVISQIKKNFCLPIEVRFLLSLTVEYICDTMIKTMNFIKIFIFTQGPKSGHRV